MSLIVAGGIKNYGEGTMEHELLNGRRGIGPDGKAWHLDTDTYERLMNMQFYRGAFATPEDLKAAHPSDIIGSYAIVLSTETFWIWVVEDAYTGWVDTHATVTEVSGLPPGGSTGQVLAKASDIDNDVVWVNQTGGGGGPISGNHNDLSGLQGGNNTERFHMTGYQHNVVSAIVAGKPTQPINLSPIDGAVDVIELETFESSPYANAFGSPMYGYQLQVIASNGTVVYDSGNVETTSVQYRIPSGKLTVTTNYTWRVRYQPGGGR